MILVSDTVDDEMRFPKITICSLSMHSKKNIAKFYPSLVDTLFLETLYGHEPEKPEEKPDNKKIGWNSCFIIRDRHNSA